MDNCFSSKFTSSIVRFISSETRSPEEYNNVTINLSRILVMTRKSESEFSSHVMLSNSCFTSFCVKKFGEGLVLFGIAIESKKWILLNSRNFLITTVTKYI